MRRSDIVGNLLSVQLCLLATDTCKCRVHLLATVKHNSCIGEFRRDGRTIQTLYCVVISCENISSIFITLQAIKVGPKLEVSHNKSYFHIKGEGLGLLKGV